MPEIHITAGTIARRIHRGGRWEGRAGRSFGIGAPFRVASGVHPPHLDETGGGDDLLTGVASAGPRGGETVVVTGDGDYLGVDILPAHLVRMPIER
jgi:hypothetical protein